MTDRIESDAALGAALRGTRIIVTRPGDPGEELAARLMQLGATVVRIAPLMVAAPSQPELLDDALAKLSEFGWIVFTSANAVRSVASRLRLLNNWPSSWPRVAVIGAATAKAAESSNIPVSFIAVGGTGREFGEELPAQSGQQVLWPRAEGSLPGFQEVLERRGVAVAGVVAYRMVPHSSLADEFRALAGSRVDALTFASPSAVLQFLLAAALEGWSATHVQAATGMVVVCLGPTTASAARSHQLRVSAVADEPSQEGLVRAVASALQTVQRSIAVEVNPAHD